MDPRATLVKKLQAGGRLRWEMSAGVVRIAAPTETGFALDLRADGDGWTVYLGEAGFHESFQSADEVLNFIGWCFSGDARVREVWRGTVPQKAVLESKEDGEWRVVSTTGYLLVPFWRPRREVILRNPELLLGS